MYTNTLLLVWLLLCIRCVIYFINKNRKYHNINVWYYGPPLIHTGGRRDSESHTNSCLKWITLTLIKNVDLQQEDEEYEEEDGLDLDALKTRTNQSV